MTGKVNASGTMPDPRAFAREAGLRYVSDAKPGLRRIGAGRNWRYLSERGHVVKNAATLSRIRALAIPPAWTNVWISPFENGHLQATGRDQRGRKQFRYHRRWRAVRDETKYSRMTAFAKALPRIRRRVARDLRRPGMPREKVLAAVTRLLEVSHIRVGNDEYARANRSYGLTTLRNRHARVSGAKIQFQFRGKSGKLHRVDIEDPRLAKIVRGCQEIPGQELFAYLDGDDRPCDVGSSDVNAYLREIAGGEFTAKDFRTWAGTVLAALALQEWRRFNSHAEARRNIVRAIESVARRLGNTPAVCRQCYVHPAILDCYLDRSLLQNFRAQVNRRWNEDLAKLRPEEAAVLTLLQERLEREQVSVSSLEASVAVERAKRRKGRIQKALR